MKTLPSILLNSPELHLMDVLKQIPTNVALYKTLSGLGATYSELKANRNSIIIEPNIPVIKGKCKSPKHKNDNLLGVYEGISTERIKQHIQASKNRNYKILTTPESFLRVQKAFQEIKENMYDSCFLLIDEAHKMVKDVNYRGDIVLPMDNFFQFKNKALVSATPLKLGDPRFEEHQFNILKIEPTFNYAKKIDIYPCNNVMMELKKRMTELTSQDASKPFFIFTNSIDLIYSIMSQFNLLDKSSVFCAPESIDKLERNDFTRCYDEWDNSLDIDNISQFNFLTSRFFNAFDIEQEVKPHLILATDVYLAEQTMLDPYSDIIQIIGRFRKGVTSISHITNTKKFLLQRSEEEIQAYIKTSEDTYLMLQTLYDSATSKGAREAYNGIINSLPFNRFLDKNKCKNWFAIDNYTNEALITGYYQNNKSLKIAYSKFTDSLDSSVHKYSYYRISDHDTQTVQGLKVMPIKDKRRAIVNQLERLGDCTTEQEHLFKKDLRTADAFIVEAYDMLGKDTLEELDYSYTEIKERMVIVQYATKANGTEIIQLIKNSFKVESKYTLEYIKKELIRIFDLLRVNLPNKITAQTINQYFNTKDVWIKKEKALLLISEKV